jgi:peptide/nickel transport system substrate-binding protein
VNNPANNEGARFDQLANVTEPDKYTVVFHLKKPYATFLEAFFSSCCANPSLLPKHLLAKYQNINNVPYNDLPVGIGPFKFVRWDKEKQIVLVANPLYWRGRPKLDKIVYTIQTDREALLADVGAHRVDLWYQFGGAYLDRIRALPGVAILRHPSYGYSHFDFNLTHPVVRELAVRQALRFALDRKRIVDELGHGVGVVQDSGLPITAPYFSDLGTTPYDPAQANALLDSAGWVRGDDGIRTKNGVKLDLAVAISSGQSDADTELDMVKSDWAKIGVAIHINHVSPALYFAPPQQGGIIFGDNSWDMVLFTWAADPYGDYSGNYGCNGFPPAGQNDVRWCNRTAQRAMDAFFGHYKQAERTADDRIVWQEFVRDVPSIVASLREDLFAYNSDLKNYRPNNITPFDNMMNVDI